MNRSMVAGAALIAGIAISAPMLAWSAADREPQFAEAAADQHGMGPGGAGDDGDHGPMAGHHGWMRGMMHRVMQLPPQQRCEERLARRAGLIAYTVARLNLTGEQRPLWDKLQGLLQAAADKERQLCTSLKPGGPQTILDRVSRREQFLSARLQGLQQVRPALEQLYQALTPEQKAIIDHPFRHG
jgi:LTXXQ motif family protein